MTAKVVNSVVIFHPKKYVLNLNELYIFMCCEKTKVKSGMSTQAYLERE